MGKSLNNYVAINDSADEQFGKLMSIPDSAVGQYARLTTMLHPREVDTLEQDVAAGGPAANRAKRRVAREVVVLYHGKGAAEQAEERFDAVFKRREVVPDAPDRPLPDGDPVHLPAALVAAGLATSTSAARRDIDAGAVRIDGVPVPPRHYDLPRADVAGRVVSSGKRRAARLVDAAGPQPS
jgi:tyrosyl-tRNA synthetase